jgi:hypothetical protein
MLRIAGLETTITDVLVRVHHADGRLESHLLRPATPSVELGGSTTQLQRVSTTSGLGFSTFSSAPITCSSCWDCC